MIFGRRKHKRARAEAIEQDIQEARQVREDEREAQRNLAASVSFLSWRREANGFGDDLEIAFTPRPRNGHA